MSVVSYSSIRRIPCSGYIKSRRSPVDNLTLTHRPDRRPSSRRLVLLSANEYLDDLILSIEDNEPEKPTRKLHCYGCGVELQTDDEESVGFIDSSKLDTKIKHRQYGQLLCGRCVKLTNGELIPAVKDFRATKAQEQKKNLISPEDLRDQLKEVRDKKAVVVLLVDVLDIPGSLLNSIRPLVGKNPIFLIATKADLLPAGSSLSRTEEWLRDMAMSKKLNAVDVRLVSNRKKTGVKQATAEILRSRNGRDVYVMGLANVGKSAFVRALLGELKDMGSTNFTADAMAKGRFLPVESFMPGTTLGIIKLQALKKKGAVYDTPGVHLPNRLTHFLPPEELRRLHPTKRLSPYIPPTAYEISKQIHQLGVIENLGMDVSRQEVVMELAREPEEISATYFWGGLVRIDILAAPPSTSLVFYGSSTVKVYSFPYLGEEVEVNERVVEGELDEAIITTRYLQNLESYLTEEVRDGEGQKDGQAREYFGGDIVVRSGGLQVVKEFETDCFGFEENIFDISVSGMPGWISIIVAAARGDVNTGVLSGRVWAPKGVEVFLRTPIPVDNPLQTEE